MEDNNVKKIGLLVIGILLVLIGWFIYDSVTKYGKTPVELVIVPTDAVISINDKIVSSNTIYLSPGKYIVKTSKEGFNTDNREVTITDEDNQKIAVALTPESTEAQEWARENSDTYLDFEGIVGDRAAEAAAENEGTILSVLPYRTHLFSIGTRPDELRGEDAFFVTVRAPEIYREAAIQQIRNLGYNPAEYNIDFIDYRNPFDVQ